MAAAFGMEPSRSLGTVQGLLLVRRRQSDALHRIELTLRKFTALRVAFPFHFTQGRPLVVLCRPRASNGASERTASTAVCTRVHDEEDPFGEHRGSRADTGLHILLHPIAQVRWGARRCSHLR